MQVFASVFLIRLSLLKYPSLPSLTAMAYNPAQMPLPSQSLMRQILQHGGSRGASRLHAASFSVGYSDQNSLLQKTGTAGGRGLMEINTSWAPVMNQILLRTTVWSFIGQIFMCQACSRHWRENDKQNPVSTLKETQSLSNTQNLDLSVYEGHF